MDASSFDHCNKGLYRGQFHVKVLLSGKIPAAVLPPVDRGFIPMKISYLMIEFTIFSNQSVAPKILPCLTTNGRLTGPVR